MGRAPKDARPHDRAGYVQTVGCSTHRARKVTRPLSPTTPQLLNKPRQRNITLPGGEPPGLSSEIKEELDALRDPLNVRAIGLRPLRRAPEHGIRVCSLQLRTYSIRNLLFFSDFAMRVAYYLGLPARGPVPLPRITERWTVPRANFIFKKSQENFERITMRRLIQIQDGHPDVVKAWLAFLQKHQYHGVGMKADIWEYESLEDVLKVGRDIKEGDYSERREGPMLDKVKEILERDEYKAAMEGFKSPVEQRM
jgi:small subunit ribosomal protein S10